MSVPASAVLARAPKLFAAAAVPIVLLWGLSVRPRVATAEEKREEVLLSFALELCTCFLRDC